VKKIDFLLAKSFIAPFIATFGIGLFVLIMQTLWVYIDDIIGKGTGMFVMIELIGYLSVSLVPMALPVATLISSVMVMGNMAEHYELAALKSAGVPLLRIMAPLIVMGFGVTTMSFMCSNYLIPVANLKFKSRLYDIKRQKPMLSLETGVFNDDFRNMIIHIGGKDQDNRTIHDVLIYDHNSYNNKKVSVITASKGEMYTSADKRFFVMNLFDGTQYQETKVNPDKQKKGEKKKKNYPFVRTSFKEWTKIFDLSEFDMRETDLELFQNNYTMLSAAQLRVAIDSIDLELDRRWRKYHNHIYRNFHFLKDSIQQKSSAKEIDKAASYASPQLQQNSNIAKTDLSKNTTNKLAKAKAKAENINKKIPKPTTKYKGTIPKQKSLDSLAQYANFLETFEKKDKEAIGRRLSSALHSLSNESQSSNVSISAKTESRVKHIFELNDKYSKAVVCLIFLFIGAPMGAIIRKGGFGYPILVSIFFFVLFIIMGIFFKKVAESNTLPALLAAWMPCAILFPLGLLLTSRAMNDAKLINWELIRDRLAKVRQKLATK